MASVYHCDRLVQEEGACYLDCLRFVAYALSVSLSLSLAEGVLGRLCSLIVPNPGRLYAIL